VDLSNTRNALRVSACTDSFAPTVTRDERAWTKGAAVMAASGGGPEVSALSPLTKLNAELDKWLCVADQTI
jgi:hypothetical protein